MINNEKQEMVSKVPEVTLVFWITKIFATTLGETGGDAISMSVLGETGGRTVSFSFLGRYGDAFASFLANHSGAGYLIATGLFAALFIAAVIAQVRAKKFHPVLYWTTIIATTTVGTTMADFADRSLGLGYAGGSSLLLMLLLGSIFVWYRTLGSVSMDTIRSTKSQVFYWVTIMFSQTLGTALGDWTADTSGFGYTGSAVIFGSILAVTAVAYYWTKISRTTLFWVAFVLTRPLGAVVGDFLDKPVANGGLALSRFTATTVLFGLIAGSILLFRHKAAEKAH
jgi:uncharacterized membrane-anchored protein